MVFKEEMDSASYGYCECDFENHEVPLVFHPSSNSCYPIYSQVRFLILFTIAIPMILNKCCIIKYRATVSLANG